MDFSQFHQVFFEESFELLDTIEHILLDINLDEVPNDTLDTIFRAAHSIKGSSSTFGFQQVAEFTHDLESYLDKIRKGQLKLNKEGIDVLLRSVDCLRSILTKLQNKELVDASLTQALIKEVNALAGEKSNLSQNEAKANESAKVEETNNVHTIYFKPSKDIYKSGYDILKIIKGLEKLGILAVSVAEEFLPIDASFDPEICYLAWNFHLKTGKSEAEIRKEIFEWVEQDSEIKFSKANENVSPILKKKIENAAIKTSKEALSIRVSTGKVDALINIVGELVITQSILTQAMRGSRIDDLEKIKEGLSKLEQNCRELQENVMSIRMLPISNVFNRFQRMVRDTSSLLNKEVMLKITGENTELDRTVLEKIGDPIVHLVRNSLDHGIEMPGQREEAGKDRAGILSLNAFHRGGNVVIEVKDDGAGLNLEKIKNKAISNGIIKATDKLTDQQLMQLIFAPGFSTAEQVSDISGRGVGMDVVKRNIESLNGSVQVTSTPGKGAEFIITLPLTLAILEGQLVRVASQSFVIPLVSLCETVKIVSKNLSDLSHHAEVYFLRNQYIPIIRLAEVLKIHDPSPALDNKFLLILDIEGKLYGIVIDELLQQQQVVIKNFEDNYKRVEGIAGATILGDGKIGLILDPIGIIKVSKNQQSSSLQLEHSA